MPPSLVAVSFTVYFPALEYVCVGFFTVEEVPSPKFHALAYLKKASEAGELGEVVVVNLSGRGDKDLETVLSLRGGI